MFAFLLKKEIAENIQNHRFMTAMIVCVVFVPLSFYFNMRNYESRKTAFEESIRLYGESRKTTIELIQNGAMVYRPPSPLMVVSTGIEYLLPDAVETVGFISDQGIRTRDVNTSSFDNPYLSLYGPLDLQFAGAVLLAVLSILFTFDAISGEKEQHSLGQMLSNAVPRSSILLAKSAASILLLSIAFFMGVVAGLILLGASGYPLLSGEESYVPFLISLGFCFLLIIVTSNLGILFSCLLKNTVITIISLISCWAFFYLILPKGGILLAKLVKPVPSQQVIDMTKNALRLDMRKKLDKSITDLRESDPALRSLSETEFFSRLRSGGETENKYTENQSRLRQQFLTGVEEELKKIDTQHGRQQAVQAMLARNIARVSPLSCFAHCMIEISNTGTLANERWQETHQRLRRILNEEIVNKMSHTEFRHMSVSGRGLDRNAPAPRVVYLPVLLGDVFIKIWPDIMLLALYGILFFTGAFASFLRYDVR